MTNSRKLHVAIVASPGMGHLNPVLLLGNRLTTHHNINVSVLVVSSITSTPTSAALHSLGGQFHVNIIDLPPVDISHLIDSSAKVVTQICMINREALPVIKSAIASMDHLPDALIVDLFGTQVFSVATEFNMPKYLFITTNAWNLALWTYVPVLDKLIKGQYFDQKEAFRIPGCRPVRPEIVVDPMWDREDQCYFEYLRVGTELSAADGVLINTWEEVDRATIKALREDETLHHALLKTPIYPIGPLTRSAESAGLKSEVKLWLDKQPGESVLYVSFGSGGTLSSQQIIEFAWGLELSQQRFIWVLRPPVDDSVDGSFFNVGENGGGGGDTTPHYLPQGFLTRIQERGLLLTSWAQQVEILNHPSIGGFLSHCGWNSILESLIGGVPLIGWPLYAEQALNATFLSEELEVAACPEVLPGKKIVGREEIAKLVRRVLEENDGKAMRDKMKKLQESAEIALSEGGSSHHSMLQFVNDLEMRLQS